MAGLFTPYRRRDGEHVSAAISVSRRRKLGLPGIRRKLVIAMPESQRIDPKVIEVATQAQFAAEQAGHGPSSSTALQAIIRAADNARGLRVEKEGRTTYKDNKFVGRWRLVSDWIEVRDAQ